MLVLFSVLCLTSAKRQLTSCTAVKPVTNLQTYSTLVLSLILNLLFDSSQSLIQDLKYTIFQLKSTWNNGLFFSNNSWACFCSVVTLLVTLHCQTIDPVFSFQCFLDRFQLSSFQFWIHSASSTLSRQIFKPLDWIHVSNCLYFKPFLQESRFNIFNKSMLFSSYFNTFLIVSFFIYIHY